MSKLDLQVVYLGEKTLSINGKTFYDAITMVLCEDVFKEYEPLKIVFSQTKKVLYFDKSVFKDFYLGEIPFETLIELTSCDELYRNNVELDVKGEIIDPGALWMLKAGEFILVDQDRYVVQQLSSITELSKKRIPPVKFFEIAK